MSGMDIAPPLPLDMVGIRLPADKSGQLTVEVSALGSDQCKSASGTVTVDLSQGRGGKSPSTCLHLVRAAVR